MLGEALKSLFPVSSIAGPTMQVHCVRSNATQGNTSIYFKQASDVTKNLSNIIKMCSFYDKIVVFYETGIFIKKKLSIFYKQTSGFYKKKLPIVIYKKKNSMPPNSDL